MTAHVLLYQLRERLRLVNERIESNTLVNPLRNNYLYAAGQLMELRSEAAFLTGLIADLEQEGIQP